MRARVLLASVLGVIVLLLLWNAVLFSPAGKDVDKAKARVEQANQDHTQLVAEKARAEKTHADLPALRARLARLQAAVPSTPDLEGFLRAAFDVKVKSGVDWVSIQPAEPAPGVGPSEIKMTIVVRGGFFQVLDYLNRFEDPTTMPRLVVVDGINLTASSGTGTTGTGTSGGSSTSGAPNLNVTLNARMFTQAAPTAPSTSGGTPVPTTPTTAATSTTTSAGG
jgi:Tfp pilus assembly protein PilO